MANSNKVPKILYAIQGTGNGHVARAREVIPYLQAYGEVEILLSGDQSEVELPVPVNHRSKGLTFIYNRSGALSLLRTLLKNNLWRLYREVRDFPVDHFDLIINDFEFISAWACKMRGKSCIGLGHQAAFRSSKVPRPRKRDWIGEWVLRYYAPVSEAFGFHFKPYDRNVHYPVIRREIRQAHAEQGEHYTVYLPAFGDEEIYDRLKMISNREWQVFSRYATQAYRKGNVQFFPIDNQGFIRSFLSCAGVLTSAGFETPAEALFLGKKLFVIPIRRQYEQACNAAALAEMGIPVAGSLNDRCLSLLHDWVYNQKPQQIAYPDELGKLLEKRIFKPLGFLPLSGEKDDRPSPTEKAFVKHR